MIASKYFKRALVLSWMAVAMFMPVREAIGQIAPGVGSPKKGTIVPSVVIPSITIDPKLPNQMLPKPSQTISPCPDTDKTSFLGNCTFSITQPKLFESLAGVDSETQSLTLQVVRNENKYLNTSNTFVIDSTTLTDGGSNTFSPPKCETTELDEFSDSCIYDLHFNSTAATRVDAVLSIVLYDKKDSTTKYTIKVPLVGIAHSKCTSFAGYPLFAGYVRANFAPLARSSTNNSVINCFYNTSSNLAAVTQSKYQFNPAGSASTLSSDLISTQFKGGFQVTLSAAAATSSCDSAASSTSNPTSSSCAGATPSASGVSQASLAQDIQQLTQGGDFGIKVLWPVYHHVTNNFQLSNFLTPKFGFTVSGLSSTVNGTTATDVNAFYADETYLQLFCIPISPGQAPAASIFFDHRWGLESVDPAFVQSAALTHHNFLMQQFSIGIVFNNSIKISGERYKGANQNLFVSTSGTPMSVNNFNNWQLSVQFAPSPKQ